jgi:hypothetical protein
MRLLVQKWLHFIISIGEEAPLEKRKDHRRLRA